MPFALSPNENINGYPGVRILTRQLQADRDAHELLRACCEPVLNEPARSARPGNADAGSVILTERLS